MLPYFRHRATWRLLVMGARNGAMKPVKIAEVSPFGEGELDVPGRPRAIHTPGHSPGHTAFHFADHGALIAGDALCTWNPLTGRPGRSSCRRRSRSRTRRRWSRSAGSRAIDAGVLLVGHGDPWTAGVDAAVARAREAGPS